MALIHVPKPPKGSRDLNRPVSSLLKMQVEHLLEAERRLPLRHRSGIYVNAIKTESEAAEYIRRVTEAIHAAHQEAEHARQRAPKLRRTLEIAAAGDRTAKKRRKTKNRTNKRGTRKK